MKHSVIVIVFFLGVSFNYSMEKKSVSFPSLKHMFAGKKIKTKNVNEILFYNESDSVLVILHGKKEEILHPKKHIPFKLQLLYLVTIMTGDLSQQFSLDEYKEGLQRFKINATCREITVSPWGGSE